MSNDPEIEVRDPADIVAWVARAAGIFACIFTCGAVAAAISALIISVVTP